MPCVVCNRINIETAPLPAAKPPCAKPASSYDERVPIVIWLITLSAAGWLLGALLNLLAYGTLTAFCCG